MNGNISCVKFCRSFTTFDYPFGIVKKIQTVLMEPETYISITALHMQDITVCCVSKIAFVSVHSWLSFWVPLMFISLYIVEQNAEYNKYRLLPLKTVNFRWRWWPLMTLMLYCFVDVFVVIYYHVACMF
jgi:hypothetical protein